MSAYQLEIKRILAEAKGLTDSDVALLQEATRIADANGDTLFGMRTRNKLISAANFSGNHELVLVAFSWCLAQIDRNELLRLRFERSVLWQYKWVVNSLAEFAQVSRVQLENSFTDMADRFKRAGLGENALYKARLHVSVRLGDMDIFHKTHALWLESPTDNISDCAACQCDGAVEFCLDIGDIQNAVKIAAPVIEGRQKCTEVPCRTFGRLLLPLLKLGEHDLAENLHQRSFEQSLSSRDYIYAVAQHCAYLSLAGKPAKALPMFETSMPWLMTMRRGWDRMVYLEYALILFSRLAAQQNQPIRLRLPESTPFYRSDSTYLPSLIASGLEALRQEITGEFNRRNGNTYFNQRYQNFQSFVASL